MIAEHPEPRCAELPLEGQEYLQDVLRYAVYADSGEVLPRFSARELRDYFENRILCNKLISHRDELGEIDGLLIWHRVAEGWDYDGPDWCKDDPNGDEMFIAVAFSDSIKARKYGILRMIMLEPDCLWAKISALRVRGPGLKRVAYNQKLLSRLLK